MTPGIPTIIKVGFTTRYNVLKSLRLYAEGACSCRGQRPRGCGIFFKLRHLLPTDVLVSLYYSIFSSFPQYGIIIWGLTHDVYTKPIFALQKKAIRAISFKSFTSPSSQIFTDLKILRLYDLFDLKLFTFVYESRNKLSPPIFHKLFTHLSDIHQYDTRHAHQNGIFMTQHNTLQYGLRSLRYYGAKS